jgi:flagellar biosynthesis/type III secretory pathway M-ring protein FliF/YscJ
VFTTVRDSVRNIIQSKTDTDVQVDMFYDTEPVSGALASTAGGGAAADTPTPSTAALVKTYAPQLGLGGLALLSLGMMMMMVRKTTNAVRKTLPTSEGDSNSFAAAADEVLAVAGGPVGRAEASEGFLVGREVDQETLQNKQLDEQVARMVDDDPAGVADLLRRWVEQDD